MLVVTRKPGTKVIVNPNDPASRIEITFLGNTGRNARIGIAARKEINIVREELIARDAAKASAPVVAAA